MHDSTSVIFLTSLCFFANGRAEQWPENPHGRQETPAFAPGAMFMDIFPLTRDNFTEEVMKKKDPWLILFHHGTLDRVWKDLALQMRGIIWIGMIDVTSEGPLLKHIKYKEKDEARVYPYGNARTKLKAWKTMSSPSELQHIAVSSIPDNTQVITMSELQDFLTESYMSTPSRFPAIFATDEEESSSLMKSVANRFLRYFNFAKIIKPTKQEFESLGITSDASEQKTVFLVLVNKEENEQLEFNAVQYNTETMGEMTYVNVLQFLFAVNKEFRHSLPGDNLSDQKNVMEMQDVVDIEQQRFRILNNDDMKPTSGEKDDILSDEEPELERTDL